MNMEYESRGLLIMDWHNMNLLNGSTKWGGLAKMDLQVVGLLEMFLQ
jgi:hypothetical protein